jgi:urease accessory protein
MTRKSIGPTLPIVVGVISRFSGIELATALPLYLQAFAANLVSAAVRLVPLGHTDGLRIVAALEPVVAEAVEAAADADLDDIGTATPMLDWCSMRHETQYTRLFRS